jgi:hypothetical protein
MALSPYYRFNIYQGKYSITFNFMSLPLENGHPQGIAPTRLSLRGVPMVEDPDKVGTIGKVGAPASVVTSAVSVRNNLK